MWFVYLCTGLGVLFGLMVISVGIHSTIGKKSEVLRLQAEAEKYQAMAEWTRASNADFDTVEARMQ